MPNKRIRYYRKKYPEINDILIAKITNISKSINNSGIYAESVEYPDLKLFIPLTEISRRKINLNKFFSPEKLYPMSVLNIDIDKNYADISYNKISENEKSKYFEKFNIYQKIYKIGIEASEIYSQFFNINIDESSEYIFDNIIWNIFDKCTGFDEIKTYELYTSLLENPYRLFDKFEQNKSDEMKSFCDEYVGIISKKIKISNPILLTEITLICLENEAVNKLKSTLTTNINPKVQIKYIASPRYEIITSEDTILLSQEMINTTIETIKQNCEKFGVKFIKQSDIIVQKNKTYIFN